jgi:hypothetical protein
MSIKGDRRQVSGFRLQARGIKIARLKDHKTIRPFYLKRSDVRETTI